MNSGRESFLKRVRQAVQEGNRAGQAPPLPVRGGVGYQGGGPNLAAKFCEALTAASGQAHVVSDSVAAAARVLELVENQGARRVLLGRGAVLEAPSLPERLLGVGIEVWQVDELSAATGRAHLFAADLSITGVDHLVAETGSLVVMAGRDNPRSLSLLPPVHIAVARAEQIVPDLFDLFSVEMWGKEPSLPSCVSLITGPSKTGDIELRLVTGVHGPGEVHVVLIT